MRRIVIASDSFKGSLSSAEVAQAAAGAVRSVFPDCEVVCLEVADGGEGTAAALRAQLPGAETVRTIVRGPLGAPVSATYLLQKATGPDAAPLAVIEMAQASGLTLIPRSGRDPLRTSTLGTGDLIADALQRGCRRFVIGLGGSATCDGGIGMLSALGWRFFDRKGHELLPVGGSLGQIAAILDPAAEATLRACQFEAACDVDAPLCGPLGAARQFAPQKGADPAAVAALDDGLASFAALTQRKRGIDLREMPGAGAAGGLGGALHAYLGATLRPGAELVLDRVGFDDAIAGADLVITGEGRLDAQTAHGKLPACVLRRADALGVPVIAIAGQVEPGAADLRIGPARFRDILCIHPPGLSPRTAMRCDVTRGNIHQTLVRYFQQL